MTVQLPHNSVATIQWINKCCQLNDLRHYKKLSYRRDSARQRSLQHSMLFNVTNFDTNRKPGCDFILVKKLTYILSRPAFQLSRKMCQIISFDRGRDIVKLSVERSNWIYDMSGSCMVCSVGLSALHQWFQTVASHGSLCVCCWCVRLSRLLVVFRTHLKAIMHLIRSFKAYIYVRRSGNQRSPLADYDPTRCKCKQVVPRSLFVAFDRLILKFHSHLIVKCN